MKTGFFDWTEENLALYIFEKKGSQYALKDTRSVQVEGDLNRSFLSSFPKDGIERVYLSLPSKYLTLRQLHFPFSDRDKIKDVIPYELEGILLGDIDNYSIDYIIEESTDRDINQTAPAGGSHVLAVCMEKEKLREIIELFLSAGIDPVVITSLELRVFSKNIKMFFEGAEITEDLRTEAAKEELSSPSVNLRQNELAYTGDIERIKKSLRLTSVLIILLLVIFGAGLTLKLISLRKDNEMLKKEINTIYRKAFPADSKIVDPARQFKGNLNLLSEKKKILSGIPAADILLNIANQANRNITLNEFSVDGEKILIKGTAPTFEKADEFRNALSKSFDEVKAIDSKSSPDNKITFSIIMKEKNT